MTAEIIPFKPRQESTKATAARLVRMWRESGGSDEELREVVRRKQRKIAAARAECRALVTALRHHPRCMAGKAVQS